MSGHCLFAAILSANQQRKEVARHEASQLPPQRLRSTRHVFPPTGSPCRNPSARTVVPIGALFLATVLSLPTVWIPVTEMATSLPRLPAVQPSVSIAVVCFPSWRPAAGPATGSLHRGIPVATPVRRGLTGIAANAATNAPGPSLSATQVLFVRPIINFTRPVEPAFFV